MNQGGSHAVKLSGSISSSAGAIFLGPVIANNNLLVSGTFTVNGSTVTFGDAAADVVTSTAQFTASQGVTSVGIITGSAAIKGHSLAIQNGAVITGSSTHHGTLSSSYGATFVGKIIAGSIAVSGAISSPGAISSSAEVGGHTLAIQNGAIITGSSTHHGTFTSTTALVAQTTLSGAGGISGQSLTAQENITGSAAIQGHTLAIQNGAIITGSFHHTGAFDVNATTTCAINNSNTSNGVVIGAETNDVPVSIGHSGAGAVGITAGAASTWSTSAGALTIDAAASTLTLDGFQGITLQTGNTAGAMSGGIILDALGSITLDVDGGDGYTPAGAVVVKFGGSPGEIRFTTAGSGDGVIRQRVDGKDLIIQQFDGSEVARFTDDLKLKFKDDGDEWIKGTGADLVLSAGGDITIDSATSKLEWGSNSGEHIVGDGSNGLTMASGAKIIFDATQGIDIDSATGDVTFMDGGTAQLALDMDTTNGEIFFQLKVDSDDLVFKQYDGNEVIRIADDRKLYFYDQGGEHISSDGTDMTIGSGNLLNLAATNDVIIPVNVGLVLDGSGNEKIESDGTDINISVGSSGDINIPADIGLTFGDDGEKIEGDGTDLTISGNNINLTAVDDVNIPSGVGLTFATTEKIESDGTDLTITVGSSGDINIPADIGLTFGNDGEKIEGDGTDLTISGNNINLTAVEDVNIPSGVGLTFATTEKIESDGTDLTITVGSSGDINIPADIGLTFGNDGEKIEGDGTDLTISGNNINLTAVEDVVVPADVGITFGTGEKIEGDNTDLTITSGADIKLTAAAFVEIPANIPLTFDGTDQADKISSDGTDMTIAVGGGDIILDASDDIHIDAGGDLVNLKKAGTTHATFDMSATDDLIVKDTGGTEIFRIDGSADSLLMASTNKIEFNDASQFIHGSSATVLSIAAADEINLDATTIDINGDVNISGFAVADIVANAQTLSTWTLPANYNSVLYGPITIGSGETVRISAGSNVKIVDIANAA